MIDRSKSEIAEHALFTQWRGSKSAVSIGGRSSLAFHGIGDRIDSTLEVNTTSICFGIKLTESIGGVKDIKCYVIIRLRVIEDA